VLWVATALSVIVVGLCGIWYNRITADAGPDRSVDLRPLGPIVVGAALLFAIWFVAILAHAFRTIRRGPRR
jgi:hypothetical protein